MLLYEANKRLKTPITLDELKRIHTLYCLLKLNKDDFCKIVDAVGVQALLEREAQYERLAHGKRALLAVESQLREERDSAAPTQNGQMNLFGEE